MPADLQLTEQGILGASICYSYIMMRIIADNKQILYSVLTTKDLAIMIRILQLQLLQVTL